MEGNKSKPRALLIFGAPCSGKTTFAEKFAEKFGLAYYDLSEIKPKYHFEVSCQKSVPESIITFLESEDFESAIRNAIWLGGDADTQAAIAGSIAEAFYGIPKELITECRNRLPDEMLEVLDRFYESIGGIDTVVIPRPNISSDRLDRFIWHDGDFEIIKSDEE